MFWELGGDSFTAFFPLFYFFPFFLARCIFGQVPEQVKLGV